MSSVGIAIDWLSNWVPVVPTCVVLSPSVATVVALSSPNVKFAAFSSVLAAVMFHESKVLFTTSAPSSDRVLLFMNVRFLPMAKVRLLTFTPGSTSSMDDLLPKGGYVTVTFIASVVFASAVIVAVTGTSVSASTRVTFTLGESVTLNGSVKV